MASLLAVDLGLRCGLALYADDGRLRWYRSTHFSSRSQLRRALPRLLGEIADLEGLVVEGDRGLAQIWGRAARLRGVDLHPVAAETWRGRLLLPRQQRDGVREAGEEEWRRESDAAHQRGLRAMRARSRRYRYSAWSRGVAVSKHA